MIPQYMDMDVPPSPEAAYRAAMASMLDMERDEVPVFEGMSADMELSAWLARDLNVYVWMLPPVVPPGLWLARVGCPYDYDVHTLVMHGARAVHDPHPEQAMPRQVAELVVAGTELLVPFDPAAVAGGAAWAVRRAG